MDEQVRKDENALLEQLIKHPGFKVVQKIAKEFEEMALKQAYNDETSSDRRLLKLGEIVGLRKLLSTIVSRSESTDKPQSWTEVVKQGVPAWQTK